MSAPVRRAGVTGARDSVDYTERLVRAEIATWPKGSRTFTDYMDSDGCGGPRTKQRCAT